MAAASSRRGGADRQRLRRRALRHLLGVVVEEDLLGGELGEAVLEEDADQRMVERQAHVEAVHALLEAAVAEVGEQPLAREVAGPALGRRRG